MTIKQDNDGSMPRDPYLRCSQAIFEAWLKPIGEASPLIDSYFGMKAASVEEEGSGITTTLLRITTGETQKLQSQYVVACDGAGSTLRSGAGLTLTGGPVYAPIQVLKSCFAS